MKYLILLSVISTYSFAASIDYSLCADSVNQYTYDKVNTESVEWNKDKKSKTRSGYRVMDTEVFKKENPFFSFDARTGNFTPVKGAVLSSVKDTKTGEEVKTFEVEMEEFEKRTYNGTRKQALVRYDKQGNLVSIAYQYPKVKSLFVEQAKRTKYYESQKAKGKNPDTYMDPRDFSKQEIDEIPIGRSLAFDVKDGKCVPTNSIRHALKNAKVSNGNSARGTEHHYTVASTDFCKKVEPLVNSISQKMKKGLIKECNEFAGELDQLNRSIKDYDREIEEFGRSNAGNDLTKVWNNIQDALEPDYKSLGEEKSDYDIARGNLQACKSFGFDKALKAKFSAPNQGVEKIHGGVR